MFQVELSYFQGPLEKLLYLVQREEINIEKIILKEITADFLKRKENESLDKSANFLSCTGLLLLLKSRYLLPKPPVQEVPEIEENPEDLFLHLEEYNKFKQVAAKLIMRQDHELNHFFRPSTPPLKQVGLGLEEVELGELVTLLDQVLQKRKKSTGKIVDEEPLSLADLIDSLRVLLQQESKISFYTFFSIKKSKELLIVSFLALLELMKSQEVRVVRQEENVYIISANENDASRNQTNY